MSATVQVKVFNRRGELVGPIEMKHGNHVFFA